MRSPFFAVFTEMCISLIYPKLIIIAFTILFTPPLIYRLKINDKQCTRCCKTSQFFIIQILICSFKINLMVSHSHFPLFYYISLARTITEQIKCSLAGILEQWNPTYLRSGWVMTLLFALYSTSSSTSKLYKIYSGPSEKQTWTRQ